jgi:acetyltransferase-like isoleucine patch superfamily enzyme
MSVVLFVIGLLPASRLKNRLLTLFGRRRGWSIARTARIHPSVFWHVGVLRMAEGAYIGPLNFFRELTRVELGEQADVGQLNWFSAQAQYVEQADPEHAASLVVRRGATVTARHYLDCAGGVRLEEFAAIGGVRSTVLTHSANVHDWGQQAAPITVGRNSLVLSNCVMLGGSSVPDRCVVAAGATVVKPLLEEGKLYGGVPARVIGDLAGAGFAERSEARLDSREDIKEMLAERRRTANA